ncbi:hypothetical protein AYK24_01250 [Thermoplasmatales archaeon SG8-52-4]|nr:MAG: hypothetical protein AYK24_01250 [Thermoplasmatales archaeon SG8-52-4]
MHKIKVLAAIISFLLLVNLGIIFFQSEIVIAQGKDIYVDDDQLYPDEADGSLYNPFKNIQDAVEAAQDGDTIKVLAGKYQGDIIIDKAITITTESIEDVLINSSKKNAYLIDIVADSVSLEKFFLEDTTPTSHRKAVIHISSVADGVKVIDSVIDYSRNGYGILIDNSHGAVIKNTTVNNSRGIYIGNSNLITLDSNKIWNCSNDPAIRITNSIGNQIINNYIDNSTFGIYASDCSDTLIDNNRIAFNKNSGVVIISGSGNQIFNNTIDNNPIYGIDLGGNDGIVYGNNIKKNSMGISIGGFDNSISNNNIINSLNTGVYARYGSKDNIIYNNIFRNNIDFNAEEDGKNDWDNGYLGNWWDDFYGPDPANINNTVIYNSINVPEIYKYKKGGIVDNYPKGKYHKQPTISNPNPYDGESGIDRNPILSVDVEDPDPLLYKERLDAHFYYILNSTFNPIGSNYNVESGSTTSVPFSSTIKGKNAIYSYKGLGYDYIGVWYVEVEDSYSRVTSPIWIFSTMNTPINNKKPIVDMSVTSKYVVGDEVHAKINDTINFDASGCYDPDGEIVFYKWAFPPDTSIINEISPSNSFKKEGTYKVNLVVIDNDGSSNSLNKTVIIRSSSNRPPVATIKDYYKGYAGKAINFNGSESYDPDVGDKLTYRWNFGDGVEGGIMSLNHVYKKKGNYTVTLTVTDSEGESDSSSTYALVKEKKSEGLPGFEALFVFIAILFIFAFKRKNKNIF